MKMIEQLQDRFTHALERLSARERMLVVTTTLFVFLVGGGVLLWSVHQAANREQQRIQHLKEIVGWMQSHVVNMKADQDLSLSTLDKVQRAAQQQSLSVSSQQQGQQIQIVATHSEYAVLANFLMQIAKNGLNIEKMQLVNEGGQLKLTAMVQ